MSSLTIKEIYTQFDIMPTLQQHMLRVAAVGKLVCEWSPLSINQSEVTEGCLFHDLGNIIKFDLQKFPEFLQPEGEEYWRNVQNEYFARYGFDEHVATLMMLKQLNIRPSVYQLVQSIGFNDFIENVNFDKPWFELWVCEYADMRVAPTGVVTLQERVIDLENRYEKKYHQPEHIEKRRQFHELMKKLEKQLFEGASHSPEEITEALVQRSTSELLSLTPLRV